jgi:transcriptional regulator NrdR family protein
MVCIYCGSQTEVTNSRHKSGNNVVWRRRHCRVCNQVFTTREQADLETSLAVASRDGTLQPFQRDTLFISIYESCKHRKQPITDAEGLTSTIINLLLKQQDTSGKLTYRHIADTAQAVLDNFDTTAATVYRGYHAHK